MVELMHKTFSLFAAFVLLLAVNAHASQFPVYQQVELHKGWNLISPTGWTYRYVDVDSGSCLLTSPPGSSGIKFLNYNTLSGSYDETTHPMMNKGYWVHSKDEKCRIKFVNDGLIGLPYITSSKLEKGWNQLGNPFFMMGDSVKLSDVNGDCKILGAWKYDSASRKYVETDKFETGKGIWIKAAGACTLSKDDSPPAPPEQ